MGTHKQIKKHKRTQSTNLS